MKNVLHLLALCTLTAAAFLGSGKTFAVIGDCADATLLEHTFSSGASWALCADVSALHALEVSSVHYRAPGDSQRSVLAQAHVAQILMHYHDEPEARAQIGQLDNSRNVTMNVNNCDGTLLLAKSEGPTVCSRIETPRILAKYAQRPSLQGSSWELSSALQRDGLLWVVSVRFSEDGQITPAITLSGKAREGTDVVADAVTDVVADVGTDVISDAEASGVDTTSTLPESGRQLTRATILGTWRLVFNLDDGQTDQVQQFDFVLDPLRGNRRSMQIVPMTSESFASVNRDQFRAWLIADPTGTGYYLDPSNSGFNYGGTQYNWTQFDLAVTRNASCERYALGNSSHSEQSDPTCGDTLDDFVSGELIDSEHPALWFSQSRTLSPTNEDWPAISHFRQSFTLLPYDWTESSPFEVIE